MGMQSDTAPEVYQQDPDASSYTYSDETDDDDDDDEDDGESIFVCSSLTI